MTDDEVAAQGMTDDEVARASAPAAHHAATPGTPEAFASENPAGPEPENALAGWLRDRLGMDLRSRFSLHNLGEALTEGGGIPSGQPTGKPPVGPAPDKLTRDAGPMAEDWGANALIGGLLGNGAGRLVGPAAKVLGRLAPSLAESAAPIAKGATSIATGAVEGGVGSKVQGGGAKSGAAVGAMLGALGPLGGLVSRSKGGVARQVIEDNGGTVGLESPGRGAPFDSMVTKGTKDADIGQQAQASAEKGLEMLNAQDAARKRPIGEQISAIDRSPAGEEPRIIDPLHERFSEEVNRVGAQPRAESTLGWALDEMDKGNAGRYRGQSEVREPIVTRASSTADPTPALEKILGRRLDQASPAEVQDAFRTLKANERLADDALRAGKPVPDQQVQPEIPADPRTLKESELNSIRRGVSERGQIGKSVEGSHATERDAAGMLRDMVNEGPYREVNRDYSRAAFTNQKDRRLLGIAENRKGPQESRATVDKVANLIGRQGQQTITAGKSIDRTAQFKARNPEIGREFAKPSMLRAKGDLSFGVLPREHGGLIDRASSAVGGGVGVGLLMHALGHPSGANLGAVATALALRNAPAIEGRLLAPAAKYAAEGHFLRLNPLFQAVRARKEDQ